MDGKTSFEIILWDAIAALVSAIDGRNQTGGHSLRVATYAVQIASAMGWSSSVLEEIRLGALLHDIGQIRWPEGLVQKQGTPLTDQERKRIEEHTTEGVQLINAWPLLQALQPYILYHQEWVDGSGYPYGLQGERIPLKVQVVSLADVYEALCHPRPYRHRPGYSPLEAISVMAEMRGKRWDVQLFDRFVTIVKHW